MSVTRTFTVTVVSTGSGNKYVIDGVQQPTINIAENGTYKLDQSDSSNSGHPLKFSTTSDGTHSGGYEYTTGVTYYGSPGDAGAYTQITVAESAPTLYYYCQYHSGMGGQANTVDDDTYGMWAWSTNEWGDQGPILFTPTGVSATSSVGSVTAAQIITVPLTGVSATSSVGSPNLDLTSVVSPTGVSATSAVGAIEAENSDGWGRQEFGNSGWGVDYAVKIGTTGAAPPGLTSSVGTPTAEEFLDVSLTGLSTTSSIGSLTTNELLTVPLTGVQAQTELGDFDNAGTLVGWGRNGWGEEPYGDSFNKLVQLSGLTSMTASVGTIAPADVVGLTGLSTTSSVGSPQIDNTEIVAVTGVLSTSSVGSLSIELGVSLTGVSATASTGSLTPADVVGLTGVSATASISPIGVAPLGYETITATQTANYTSVNAGT